VRKRRRKGGKERERERERDGKIRIGYVAYHQEQYMRDGPYLVICADSRPASANNLEIWRPPLEE
jgi:hypothetical protein